MALGSRFRGDERRWEAQGRDGLHFRIELVWQDDSQEDVPSIYLTADGRVILQGKAVSPQEREHLKLPAGADLISVDRSLIRAIKEML